MNYPVSAPLLVFYAFLRIYYIREGSEMGGPDGVEMVACGMTWVAIWPHSAYLSKQVASYPHTKIGISYLPLSWDDRLSAFNFNWPCPITWSIKFTN